MQKVDVESKDRADLHRPSYPVKVVCSVLPLEKIMIPSFYRQDRPAFGQATRVVEDFLFNTVLILRLIPCARVLL